MADTQTDYTAALSAKFSGSRRWLARGRAVAKTFGMLIDPSLLYGYTGRVWVTSDFTVRIDLGDPRQPPWMYQDAGSVDLWFRPDDVRRVHAAHGRVARVGARAAFVQSVAVFE